MLSQGRVKPNSATRHGVPQQKLLVEANAVSGLYRPSAPEPVTAVVGGAFAEVSPPPPTTSATPGTQHSSSGNLHSHRSGNGHGAHRSNSSLAVAHQEFTAASTSTGVVGGSAFPPQPLLRNTSSTPVLTGHNSASGGNSSSTSNGRKGVAPFNARPVPVSSSPSSSSGGGAGGQQPLPHHVGHAHSADVATHHGASSSSSGGGGPVLSNTARHQQQQQQLRMVQAERDDTTPILPSKLSRVAASVSSGSSANSSENSPTTVPLHHNGTNGSGSSNNLLLRNNNQSGNGAGGSAFPAAPAIDLTAGGNGAVSSHSMVPQHGSPRYSTTTGGRTSHRDLSNTSDSSGRQGQDDGNSSDVHSVDDANAAQHQASTESSGATTGSSTVAPQRSNSFTATKRNVPGSSTPTPPPGGPTASKAKTSGGHAKEGHNGSSPKAPQIDIGPACQALSLYDAFSFDTALKMWVVRDDVLSKCLEYIRIMGYQHPLYARTLGRAAGDPSGPLKTKMPSIWCPSATMSSPIVASANNNNNNHQNSSTARAAAVASPTVPNASKLDDKSPPTNQGPQWRLLPLPVATSGEGGNATTSSSGCGDHGSSSDSADPPPLFFECEESLRWLAEQEYVIGTILLTCSFEPLSTTEKRAKQKKAQHATTEDANPHGVRRQYVPAHTHPIRYVAAHVIHNFSHWGDFKSFSSVWDAQVRLVLGVAQPSHQKIIPVPETGLAFSSEFESGNLARVQRHVQGAYNNPFAQSGVCPPGASTNVYLLWIEGDTQSDKRLWFRFAVTGCKEREPLCIRMMNIAPNARLYRNGMKPVWRAGASQLQWTSVDDYTFHLINDDRDGELSFYIVPKSSFETIHVAFCVPYSYGDLLCHITQWHAIVKRSACNIRFEERVLCRTLDERKLHLLIITSQTEKIGGKQQQQPLDSRGRPIQPSGATPYSAFTSGKKVILVSGRVHPGEVTASHAVHGIVSFLLSHDPRAATLREHFIFFVVPMLNPDGVARGYSRLDQNGLNLNRCYNDPNPLTQPTVHSLRNVFDHLQTNFRDRFFMYLDFHSHASQQSGFAFGNHLPNSVQHWNMLFPKLISIHSNELFDFETCRFSRGHMVSKDGTSRVLFGGSLIHSYTIELTHFTDFKTFGDRHPNPTVAAGSSGAAPVASSTPTSSEHPTTAKSQSGKEKAKETTKATTKEDGGKPSASTASATPASGGAVLQSPVINGVLCHSADVGRACVLALLDYCSIGDASPDLLKFGGMDRIIREVKREIRGGGPQRPSSYSSQSSFKQY